MAYTGRGNTYYYSPAEIVRETAILPEDFQCTTEGDLDAVLLEYLKQIKEIIDQHGNQNFNALTTTPKIVHFVAGQMCRDLVIEITQRRQTPIVTAGEVPTVLQFDFYTEKNKELLNLIPKKTNNLRQNFFIKTVGNIYDAEEEEV